MSTEARRPRIGITECNRVDDYVASISKAGGDPEVLKYDQNPADVIHEIDGLLLTGGADVEPARYGQEAHPATYGVNPTRDAFEVGLTERALATDTPVLAICRGMQVLNVAADGDLVQDIPSQQPLALAHSVTRPSDAIAHTVAIRPESLLGRILESSADLEACDVNSRHHQSVGRVAPGFSISATSPDGIVEAIERSGASFCVGVQWHPENFHRSAKFDQLFKAFVDACKRDGL